MKVCLSCCRSLTMLKIGTYGCSWTAGTFETNFECWPDYLARMNKNIQVDNYSTGGLSMQAILYLFEKNRKNYDINIVKMTSQIRHTFIDETFEIKLENKTDNYKCLAHSPEILTFNAGGHNKEYVRGPWKARNTMRMYRTMFEHHNEDYATVQCQALAKYFKHKADFVFCHRHKYLYDLPQIKDVIDFDEFVVDDGHHFGPAGANLEAQWVSIRLDKIIKGLYNKK